MSVVRKMYAPAATEVSAAAQLAAQRHSVEDRCDPHGAWYSWLNRTGAWNSSTYEESKQVEQERPIAHKAFTGAYLNAQGWKR